MLDESSILKAYDGKTRTRLIRAFAETPYRLCCTATPAPNDIAELANHCEFLGIMTRAEMLATWFVHDEDGWRLKGHAHEAFYRWLVSWGIFMRLPSDLGFADDGYRLPGLEIREHVVTTDAPIAGEYLFPSMGLGGIGGRTGTPIRWPSAIVCSPTHNGARISTGPGMLTAHASCMAVLPSPVSAKIAARPLRSAHEVNEA